MALSRATKYDAVRQEFLSLYPNRIQGILRPPGCKTWVTVSKHFPIGDDTILGAIAGTETNLWGLRFGDQTRFALFDIDAKSRYHNVQELQKLNKSLNEVGLTATVCQSSESGGWHVYLFLQDWENAKEVQGTMRRWLAANQYEVRNGTLEVFPSGMGLRLPLQAGFAWLDNNGGIVLQRRENLTTDQAMSRFLSDLRSRASDWNTCKSLIESQIISADAAFGDAGEKHRKSIDTEGFDGLFSYRLILEKYQDGRRYWQEGLTEKGQRHDAILAIEHYFWHGDLENGVPALPGEWNDDGRYRLILAWLREKHNGFCNQINRGNWRKVEAQIRRAVKWRRPAGSLQVATPYAMTERLIERLMDVSRATGRIWSTDDLKKGNDRSEQKARAKISAALELLISQGVRIGRNELARASGCSPNTVSKHRDLWLLLASGSGDQNPSLGQDLLGDRADVGGAGSGAVLSEETFLPPLLFGDSGQTELPGQPAQIPAPENFVLADDFCSVELAPIVLNAPLLFCLADSLPAKTQHQGEVLQVASQALTLGPWFARYSGRTADAAGGLQQPRTRWDTERQTSRLQQASKSARGCVRNLQDNNQWRRASEVGSAPLSLIMQKSQFGRALFILPYFVHSAEWLLLPFVAWSRVTAFRSENAACGVATRRCTSACATGITVRKRLRRSHARAPPLSHCRKFTTR